MKRVFFAVFIMASVFMGGFYSCSSDDTENVIDCLFEPVNFSVKHVATPGSTKEIVFTLSYSGEYNLDQEVEWNFGDGTTMKISGTQATHTYAVAGVYKVVIKPTVRNGDAYCTPSLDRNINVE